MPVSFRVRYNRAVWLKLFGDKERVATAAVAALRDIAAASVQEGRANIAGSGRFGGKWISGLQYRTVGATKDGQPSLQAKAIVFHKYGIAGVFEHGATIAGKPLLWIPTTRGAPPAKQSGKKLVSGTVRGVPMLFDASDHTRDRKPLYIGVPSVRIPKKWRITEIVKKNVQRFSALFSKHFKASSNG